MTNVAIRQGQIDDIKGIFNLVKELAIYENALAELTNTEQRMREDGFGEKPYFHTFVAELEQQIIGVALYYFSYSSWKGKSMYIDDLIVTEEYRHTGVGQSLFKACIEEAKQQQVYKLHWQVLDWNAPAIDFYKKIGATFDAEWINCKILHEKIQQA
ncbi:GNAT family N-acetyltransferase [Candidatus Albibeggiatoa sp. nov. BB20]|uniref:GNAT family N-acetyltransferase n=1 Tax=Candidatus Albibeggiatoa sp. nov. BB20 TaxID=3162723 RepID=UPI003365534E